MRQVLLAALAWSAAAIAVSGMPAARAAAQAADDSPGAQAFDATHSRVGFQLRTRWGKTLQGGFPRFEGAVVPRPDGHRQVRLRLAAADVEVEGRPSYTQWARGEGFFDAARHPWVEFVSDPYPATLLQGGGVLTGTLTMLGVQRQARFQLAPGTCARPGQDCDVVARGVIDRTDFGMDAWRVAVQDEVRFDLRMRLRPAQAAKP